MDKIISAREDERFRRSRDMNTFLLKKLMAFTGDVDTTGN